LAPEINRHFARWHEEERISKDYLLQEWSSSVDKLKRFTGPRRDTLLNRIYDYLNMNAKNSLEVQKPINGEIYVDGIELQEAYSGRYFDNAKVKLKAVAKEGYKFDRWVYSDNRESKENEIEVILNTKVSVKAEFISATVPKIVINEINYKSSKDLEVGDWIELYNNDDKDIDISGWKVKDDKEEAYIFEEGTIIKAGEYIVLAEKIADFNAGFPSVIVTGEFPFGLGKKGDAVRVFNKEDVMIDNVVYDDTFPDASGNGMTLSLKDPNLDNSISDNWEANKLYGSPNAKNE